MEIEEKGREEIQATPQSPPAKRTPTLGNVEAGRAQILLDEFGKYLGKARPILPLSLLL